MVPNRKRRAAIPRKSGSRRERASAGITLPTTKRDAAVCWKMIRGGSRCRRWITFTSGRRSAAIRSHAASSARRSAAPAVEPPRDELFVRAQHAPDPVAAARERARIASPANGLVIAIDPDIPAALQRVPLAAHGAQPDMVLRLNGARIGSAERSVMWLPERGTWLLALEDAAGHTVDSAQFVVR